MHLPLLQWQAMFGDLTIMLISKITRCSFGETSGIWDLSPERNWENEIFKKKFDLKDECGAEWKVLFRLKGVIVNFVIYYVAPISPTTKKKIQSYLTGFFLNGNLTLETQKKTYCNKHYKQNSSSSYLRYKLLSWDQVYIAFVFLRWFSPFLSQRRQKQSGKGLPKLSAIKTNL